MYKNLTPHSITVKTSSGFITLLPEEKPARVSETTSVIETIEGVDLVSKSFGEVVDLPNEESTVFLVVSAMVRSALPNRKDLLSPGDLIRDTAGVIIGCKNLVANY